MSNVFKKYITEQPTPSDLDKGRDWWRERAHNIERLDPTSVLRGAASIATNRFRLGHLYYYRYDPKHKDTLPYYDRYPIVFPVEYTKEGFLGINLHYLPYQFRALLMDNLYNYVTGKEDMTKLRITYNTLSGMSKLRYYKPCLKHYLNNQIRTRFYHVDVEEWDVALFLPLQRFAKKTENQVHRDSIRIIRTR